MFLAFLVALKMMRDQRRKQSEPFWSSMVMKKWLNIRPKLNDFSEDEFDTGSEDSEFYTFSQTVLTLEMIITSLRYMEISNT